MAFVRVPGPVGINGGVLPPEYRLPALLVGRVSSSTRNALSHVTGKPKKPERARPVPAPKPRVHQTDAFLEALVFVLDGWGSYRGEGGYVNHPKDPGGATNRGVTQKVYDEFRKSKQLRSESVEVIGEDEVKEIYRTRYWIASKAPLLPYPLNVIHMDSAVNSGPRRAIKWLQSAIGVSDDGKFGGQTMTAVGKLATSTTFGPAFFSGLAGDIGVDEKRLVPVCKLYLSARNRFLLAQPDDKKKAFYRGWLNRLIALASYTTIDWSPGTGN